MKLKGLLTTYGTQEDVLTVANLANKYDISMEEVLLKALHILKYIDKETENGTIFLKFNKESNALTGTAFMEIGECE